LNAPSVNRSEAGAVIRSPARLRGELRMPGDKSISHRALMLAALAEGTSRIDGAGDGADVRSTVEVLTRLGTRITRARADDRTVDYVVESPGADGFRSPDRDLDCGNSGTTLRLMAGILAGLPLTAVLDGDASLRSRPVARIIEPLRAMGAEVRGRDEDRLPPVTVRGGSLRAIEYATPVASAQVKSAILLAALRADGRTVVRESVATRDHSERMLRARGVAVDSTRDGDGASVTLNGHQSPTAVDDHVPGDPSAAAFWLVAACLHPDAELLLRGVGVNPTRRAAIDILGSMGARIDERPIGRRTDGAIGEPVADLAVRTSDLNGVDLGPRDVAAAIDEMPILCLAAALARGRTAIHGAGELRHKESDRLTGIAEGLHALGAQVTIDDDALEIVGRPTLRGTAVESHNDHRLAMTFAVAGLLAVGETVVLDPASARISYPGFFDDLERISA
jgi:3-phosphoshikimate 1-carboxyvinyltransferase